MLLSLILGITIGLIAILLMGVRVFFTKEGEFPNTHIGANRAMQERGIECASSQDAACRQLLNPIEKIMKNENY